MRLDSNALTHNLSLAVQRQKAAAQGETADPQTLREGLRVTLSELGQARSASAQKHNDIDDSELPQTIKQILKMIRELKAQIAAKQAELKALLADSSLDAQARRVQAEAIQGELSSLNGALASANANLIQIMREQGLSSEQMQLVATLAMK